MASGWNIDRGEPLGASKGAAKPPKAGGPTGGSRRGGKPGRGARQPAADPADGTVRVGRQTQGRKGKGVTVVTGVPLEGEALQALGRELKQRCGAGGTVRDGVIEVQGDHRDVLVVELERRGYTVKRAGG